MKFQRSKSSCGPASLSNALECLGLRRSEEELAVLCKQTAEGTSPANLLRAIKTIEGTRNTVIHESRADVGLLKVLQALYEGRPVIVCVTSQSPWDHWAVAAGVLGFGNRIVSVDSADNELVRARTIDDFEAWWRGPEAAGKPYYGVVV